MGLRLVLSMVDDFLGRVMCCGLLGCVGGFVCCFWVLASGLRVVGVGLCGWYSVG